MAWVSYCRYYGITADTDPHLILPGLHSDPAVRSDARFSLPMGDVHSDGQLSSLQRSLFCEDLDVDLEEEEAEAMAEPSSCGGEVGTHAIMLLLIV